MVMVMVVVIFSALYRSHCIAVVMVMVKNSAYTGPLPIAVYLTSLAVTRFGDDGARGVVASLRTWGAT